MHRSKTTKFDSKVLIRLKISTKVSPPGNKPRHLQAARSVIQAVWPDHRTLLTLTEPNTVVVFEVPSSSASALLLSDLQDAELNDGLRIRIDYVTEADLEALKREGGRPPPYHLPPESAPFASSDGCVERLEPVGTDHRALSLSHPSSQDTHATRPASNVRPPRPKEPSPPIQQDTSDPKPGRILPANPILHICNFDRDFFKSAFEIANFLSIYGPIAEMIYLTNLGKAFVRYVHTADASAAMDDINRFERPPEIFLRANYSFRDRLSTTFRNEHHNSRQYNDVLQGTQISQRTYQRQKISKTIRLSFSGPASNLPEAAARQLQETVYAHVYKTINVCVILGTPKDSDLTLTLLFPSELAAIKAVSKLHGAIFHGATCTADFQADSQK